MVSLEGQDLKLIVELLKGKGYDSKEVINELINESNIKKTPTSS